MIRLIFEICQLRHHAVNWLQLPKSIGQNIDKIFDFIHLPRPNDILMGCMTSVKTLLQLELQEAGHTHIKTQLEKALNKLKLIDPTDKFKCITIVKHKLWNNLKSINRVDLDSWINECMDTVGTQFTQTKTQPGTHNTYSDIVQRNSVRTNNVTVNAQQTHTSSAQNNRSSSHDDFTLVSHSRKQNNQCKRQLPVSPPLSIGNRFDLLRDLETESPIKMRKLTVDEAPCISQVKSQVQSQRNGEWSRIRLTSMTAAVDAGQADAVADVGAVAEVASAAADADVVTKVVAAMDVAAAAEIATADGAITADVADAIEVVVTPGGVAVEVAAGTDIADAAEGTAEADAVTVAADAAATAEVAALAATADSDAVVDRGLDATQGDRRLSALRIPIPSRPIISLPNLDEYAIRNLIKDVVRNNKYLFTYDGLAKHTWFLQVRSQASTVILGDSNFRRVQLIDDNFEVHAFSGARLAHTCRIIECSDIPDTVRNLVIAVGINDRSRDFNSITVADAKKLATATKNLKQRVYFLGISSPKTLTPEEDDNIIRLNGEMAAHFGSRFIPPIPRDQVEIDPKDPYKIHHTNETVRKVFSSLINHIPSAVSLN